ncbi:proline dehydrogenase family protein [Agrococcus jejuensis]|uniref:L-glutamate gamma-semialdehyde dehydrogenase n=1 Tax=Agrococcus jejuensis TaxID=399736 RepID=A0A1G8E4Z9_9MICO|nr:proline dehydrogenase family protein [Agrococcus jejuensis]SDH64934.1 L-proline dehydrogenase [Agrococcus jejuensis]
MTDAPRGDSADFDDILRAGAAEADAYAEVEAGHAHVDGQPDGDAEAEPSGSADEQGLDDLDAIFGDDVEVLDEQHAPRTGETGVVDVDAPVAPTSAPTVVAPIPPSPPFAATASAPHAAPAEEPFWVTDDAAQADPPTQVLPTVQPPAQPVDAPPSDPWTVAAEAARASAPEVEHDWQVVADEAPAEPIVVEPTVVEPTVIEPEALEAEPAAAAGPEPEREGWMLSQEQPTIPPAEPTPTREPRGWMLSASDHAHGSAPGWDAIARTQQVPPLEVDPILQVDTGNPFQVVDASAGAEPAAEAPAAALAPEPAVAPAAAEPAAAPAAPRADDAAERAAQWSAVEEAAIGQPVTGHAPGVVPPFAGTAPLPPLPPDVVELGTVATGAAAGAAAAAPPAASAPAAPNPLVPGPTGTIAGGSIPEPGPAPVSPAPLDPKAAARAAILRPTEPDTDDELAQAAITRVRGWLAREGDQPRRRDRSAERLAGLLADERGLDFAIGFVDRVVRPEDPAVSARAFDRLSRELPDFLDWYLKLGVTMGGGFGVLAPGAIIPIAKRAMRSLVSHLVLDATPDRLAKSFARLRADGTRLNVNLLGEAVLGEQEAEQRLRGTIELLQRDDVDYVSIKVSSMAPQLQPWAFDETVASVVERLLPLYRVAATKQGPNGPAPAFINLDMEEYRDLDLTIAVFQRLLEQPELGHLHAGVVLQAYLPDALGALDRLTAWAQARVDAGGAPIKVRVVKGANLAMERVDAAVHGWPLTVLPSKADTDANYKRVLLAALTPERTRAVRVGVAGHNLFDLAFAVEVAYRTGTIQSIDVEMLLGMAAEHIDAIRADVPAVLLYTPVVRPKEFDAAVAYLVRRLEENGSGDNFMSSMYSLGTDLDAFTRERDRFLASIDILQEQGMDAPAPNRVQDRGGDLAVAVGPVQEEGFANEPDTDASLPANRAWGRQVLERAAQSTLGIRTLELNRIEDVPTLDRRIGKAVEAAAGWAALGAEGRARVLRDAAVTLGAYRGRLLEVMAAETGKTLAEGDPEVSEAIDFARYYADQAIRLEQTHDARPVPVPLTVVVPPWNFPVAIPAGGITAALATGSAVIVKPAPQSRRSAAVLLEALWEAGVPRDVLVLCDMEEGEVSQHLVAHPSVGRLILTGSSATAALFSSWRADLPLLAETSGKNGIVVTPSADLDLAVADLVRSAFGHAGQKCSAASLGILVGSVGTSERFRRQLVDAVQTLRVGSPLDPRTHVGPIIEPASGALLQALTTLGEGESWLVEPRQLDAEGRVWSPGVRVGVQPGSFTHTTELFGPHLSLIAVRTLDEAIAVQNATDFGLTAGIHSLDVDEVHEWMQRVQAGNLYVNRGITGAIVRRQPFGGWRLSQVGPGAKAGGPSYLATLVDWEPVFQPPRANVKLAGLHQRVSNLIESATPQLDFLEFDRIRAGANSDQRAWEAELGLSLDVSSLGVERNVLRHRPTQTLVRLADDGTMGQLVRVLAAAARARATVRISTSQPLPPGLERLVTAHGPVLRVEEIVVERDDAFHDRLRSGAAVLPVGPAALDDRGAEVHDGLVRSGEPTRRIRLCGTDAGLRELLAGNPTIAVYDAPITVEGRLELMPFLREQAVSITAHRFGNPDEAFATLEV